MSSVTWASKEIFVSPDVSYNKQHTSAWFRDLDTGILVRKGAKPRDTLKKTGGRTQASFGYFAARVTGIISGYRAGSSVSCFSVRVVRFHHTIIIAILG